MAALERIRVEEGCRRVALEYLSDAVRARARLEDPADLEALHDLRVALRRLRSLERAYRSWMQDSFSSKLRRRLRELARSTNVARDTEVQLEWLGGQRDALKGRHRRGLEWMIEWLEQRKVSAYADVRREVAAEFDDFHRRAEAALRRYTARLAADDERPLRFGEETGRLLVDHAEALCARLAAIGSAFDDEPAHEARIEAKRLRYLIEPLRHEREEAKPLIARIKAIQDLLGELHDAAVMAGEVGRALEEAASERARRQHRVVMAGEAHADDADAAALRRDERPGLLALAHRVRERRDTLFAELERRWLGAHATALRDQCRAVAEQLGAAPIACASQRFALRAWPQLPEGARPVDIEEGTLRLGGVELRLRRVREADGERLSCRIIWDTSESDESELGADVFAALWPLTAAQRRRAQRVHIGDEAAVWELLSAGAPDDDGAVAVARWPRDLDPPLPPDWLSPFLAD